MSSVALAPLLGIDGPLPLAPRYNFFTVALDLDDPRVRQQLGMQQGDRWQAGVNVLPRPTQTPFGWTPCSPGTMRVKEDGSQRDWITFLPFVAYIPDFCSGLGVGDWDYFKGVVEDALTATESFAAEVQFAKGEPEGTNPSLNDNHTASLLGTDVSPAEGLALLENAIGATAREGVIHATPATGTYWTKDYLIEPDGSVMRTVAHGTPVIIGNGYIGTDPDLLPAPSGRKEYAFATGPVFAGRGPVRESNGPIGEYLDRQVNDVVYRAEREMLVGWDGALQVAVRIDRSVTP